MNKYIKSILTAILTLLFFVPATMLAQDNTSVPNHWHHSAERMVLVSGKMEVQYKGQEPAVISAGDYAYGPPEKPHTASCVSDEPCVLFIAWTKPVDAFAVE